MKTKILLFLLLASTAIAGYDIKKYTIDSGGGKSAGGQYIVTGTIGQPDAAYSASGQYELFGGFWPAEPSCFVDFENFAKFAEYWMQTGTGLPADLFRDNVVDYIDLGKFVEEWLCYCPYGWSLR
jgi:hypothetical protein